MAFGTDGGHIEGGTNGGVAGFGNSGFLFDGGAGLVMGRVETCEGDELTHIVKAADGATFSQELGGSQLANAGNGVHQVALTTQVREVGNVVLDGRFELVNLRKEQSALAGQL